MKKYILVYSIYLALMYCSLLFMRYTSDQSIAFFYKTFGFLNIFFSILAGILYLLLTKNPSNKARTLITLAILCIVGLFLFNTLASFVFYNEGSGV